MLDILSKIVLNSVVNIIQKINAIADWLDFSDPASPFFGWLLFLTFVGAWVGTYSFAKAIIFTLFLCIPIGFAAIITISLLRLNLYVFAWLLSLISSANHTI